MLPPKLRGLSQLWRNAQLSLFDSEPAQPSVPRHTAPVPAPVPAPIPAAPASPLLSSPGLAGAPMVPTPAPFPTRPLPPVPRPALPPEPLALPPLAGQHLVVLHGQAIPYELKRARRRSIGFTVSDEGLRVSAPKWVPVAEIDKALQQKGEWILRKLVEQRERARRTQAARVLWGDGCSLPYLGEPLIVVLDPAITGARLDEGNADTQPTLNSVARRLLYLGLPQSASPAQIRDAVQAWLQRQARQLFEQRCRHFAPSLGVAMAGLRLSSAQTRWGSASADGMIRLNWRLIHFSPALIDYVVAHELAHLREMNHSPRFWAVVRSVMPEYEHARDRLKQAVLPLLDDL